MPSRDRLRMKTNAQHVVALLAFEQGKPYFPCLPSVFHQTHTQRKCADRASEVHVHFDPQPSHSKTKCTECGPPSIQHSTERKEVQLSGRERQLGTCVRVASRPTRTITQQRCYVCVLESSAEERMPVPVSGFHA